MLKRLLIILVAATFTHTGFLTVAAQSIDGGAMMVWVVREYGSWDNPLHSEFSINGKLVNVFTADTFESIEGQLKNEWNTITIKTTPQEPANKANGLIFRIGPMRKDGQKMVMEPVLWEFRNDTDWKFDQKTGTYSHPLGPGVKEVTLSYSLYFAGMQQENGELKAGDFILRGKPTYGSWNSPVTATVFINGTPFNSFTLQDRTIVITSLLKPGKNEIKLISSRVKNSIKDNDIGFEVLGPAEWNVQQNKYLLAPLVQFKSMQGWRMDPKTGVLINPAKPDSETIERVIPFILKESAR
ncbi:MAG: hypothetical protein HY644_03955 [Acidobacteria bacterium]|nr:hypothetical protein [Acidobacteriota bacterium]